MRGARGAGVARRRLLSVSVCFAHPGGTTYGDIETLNVHV